MIPKLISFYTGDPYYASKASELKNRCYSLGIEVEISEVRNQGDYWKNTLYKPVFIYKNLIEKKEDLIWIDVDTEIVSKNSEMFNWTSDLYFASHTGEMDGIKASPIGFRFNDRTLSFVDEWKRCCELKISSGDVDFDHDVLKYDILPQFKGRVSLQIMKGNLEAKEFTNGVIINNGNSRVHGKAQQTRHVLRKNNSRSSLFECLKKEDFIYESK
jgi:hypothetical protein